MRNVLVALIIKRHRFLIVKNTNAEFIDEWAFLATLKRWVAKGPDSYFAHCWHMAENESAPMWSIYGLRGQSIAHYSKLFRSCFRTSPFC